MDGNGGNGEGEGGEGGRWVKQMSGTNCHFMLFIFLS